MITVSDPHYTYPGNDAETLSGVSFAVVPGEIFGLLGPSGAGKTTLQGVLTRRNRRYRGDVGIFGRALPDWNWKYYQRIGVGFEFLFHYLKLTARENLRFFGSLYQGPVADPESLLAMVGLTGDADKRVGHFSKGMMTRLNFVRALAHDPELLFLDEPTAGLDPVNSAQIKKLIRERQQRGNTVILTTHNMHDVDEPCDRVALIVGGRLVTIDEPEALKHQHGKRSVRVEYSLNGSDKAESFAIDTLAEDEGFHALLRDTRVQTIHSQEATLDKVFAEVTGVTLTAPE